MRIQSNVDQNSSLSQHLLSGYDAIGPSLKLPESAVHLLRSASKNLRQKEKQFQASRSRRVEVLKPALQKAQQEAFETIDAAKKVIRFKVGAKRSPVWAEAGFGSSTQTPSTVAARESLLDSLATFLENRPEMQDESLGLTSAKVLQRASVLTKTLSEMDLHDARHAQLSEERAEAMDQLRYRMRNFINELSRVLADDDTRWKTFGLESPAGERALRPARRERTKTRASEQTEKKAKLAQQKADKAQLRMEKAKAQAAKALEAAEKARKIAVEQSIPDSGTAQLTVMAA